MFHPTPTNISIHKHQQPLIKQRRSSSSPPPETESPINANILKHHNASDSNPSIEQHHPANTNTITLHQTPTNTGTANCFFCVTWVLELSQQLISSVLLHASCSCFRHAAPLCLLFSRVIKSPCYFPVTQKPFQSETPFSWYFHSSNPF